MPFADRRQGIAARADAFARDRGKCIAPGPDIATPFRRNHKWQTCSTTR